MVTYSLLTSEYNKYNLSLTSMYNKAPAQTASSFMIQSWQIIHQFVKCKGGLYLSICYLVDVVCTSHEKLIHNWSLKTSVVRGHLFEFF